MLGLPIRALAAQGSINPAAGAVPFKVTPALANAAELAPAAMVKIGGWLGARVNANAHNRLLNVDLAPLLAGFQSKPGSHPWIGEHIGKWLHAATLAWANDGDAALRDKLDGGAAALIAAQESDGYLGTYLPDKRFGLFDGADWDVWSHKYCLIGLLTYYQHTGAVPALNAAKRAADLLIVTFPAKRSILAAGTHLGMAATSVLEPIVLLYRLTAEPRYLDFARYIVASWDEAGGPGIVSSLLRDGKVRATANAKAYEMLSNIVGMSELARVTGDHRLIEAALAAWNDITATQRYITGTTSRWEHFQVDHDLRGDVLAHVGETCVTTTWIQLNLSLLQLTGEARFGDELERSWYNHLSAAQHPGGDDWCYFTALEGRKHYDKVITCCHSSGPRAMALAPLATFLTGHGENSEETLLVNSFETAEATLTLGGQQVFITQTSGFPRRGRAKIRLGLAQPARFGLKLRAPEWATPLRVSGAVIKDGWAHIPARTWHDGDVVSIGFTLESRLIEGTYLLEGRAAMSWGPFVLAYDQLDNPGLAAPHLLRFQHPARLLPARGAARLEFEAVVSDDHGTRHRARLRSFADAGAGGGVLRVWLRAADGDGAPPHESLLIGGTESRSRQGTLSGSINDEDYESIAATNDGQLADQDWFSVRLAAPVSARRFQFLHGKHFHDGGWFDTSTGKPLVQIMPEPGSAWQTIGALEGYPETTATSPDKLIHGWFNPEFVLNLDAPRSMIAVRVIGKPASGDNPAQSFASCAQLQTFST
jgi:DUF1680 family protein